MISSRICFKISPEHLFNNREMKGYLATTLLALLLSSAESYAYYEDFTVDARSMGMANTGFLFSGTGGMTLAPSCLFSMGRNEVHLGYGLPWSTPEASGYFFGGYGTPISKRTYGGLSIGHRFIKDTSLAYAEDALSGAFSYAFDRLVMGGYARVVGKRGFGNDSLLAAQRFPRKASAGFSGTFWPGINGLRLAVGVADLGTDGTPLHFWTAGTWILTQSSNNLYTPLVSWTLGYRGGDLGIALGTETWLWNRLGLRAGTRLTGADKPSFSMGLGYRSVNIESTDWEIDYALNFPYNGGPSSGLSHWIGLKVRPGDALARQKAEALQKEQEALLAQREKQLDSLLDEMQRLKDELAAERAALEEERAKLEAEKKNVEKMREEAMAALKKIEGLKIEEEKSFIKITAGEKAIHFASGSADLPVEAIAVLKKVARFLSNYPKYPVEISGHTDNVPISQRLKSKYPDNQALSEARAKAVRDYFVLVEGLPGNLFSYKGYGETKPVADNSTEQGRAANRRVEILITKPNGGK